MSVKIKLRREGGKKKAFYQVVVIDSRKPAKGEYLEKIGYYQPLADPYVFHIDREASLKWMERGAQLSKTVKDLFKEAGVIKSKN